MKTNTTLALIVVSTLLFCPEVSAQDTLKSKLKDAGWEGVIGEWVDKETKGKTFSSTYKWSIENQVIEVRTKDPTNETVALMGVNASNGQIFHMGADKNGTSSIGEWKIDADGSAVLSIVATSPAGQISLKIRHKLIGKDKMQLTIQLPQPIEINLVRKKR
ncbi:MAG: hypothetical protein AAGA30_14710 [Planctomycetota bacterium]